MLTHTTPDVAPAAAATRKPGWYRGWNTYVTQAMPLIGSDGLGLLNAYTVWIDHRPESPRRGWAYPTQEALSAFSCLRRAEIVTINKILVTLGLLEIRVDTVVRRTASGRMVRAPRNLYRVVEHPNGFTLTPEHVRRVLQLAATDVAVYRRIRRIFLPRFAPIDSGNVWTTILPILQAEPLWQDLAARAGSAKTELPTHCDATDDDTDLCSPVDNGDETEETIVLSANKALDDHCPDTDKAQATFVRQADNGGPTFVRQANSTYDLTLKTQDLTLKTKDLTDETNEVFVQKRDEEDAKTETALTEPKGATDVTEQKPRETEPRPAPEPPRPVAPRFVVDGGLTNTQLWALALEDLERALSRATFETWIRPLQLVGQDDGGRILVLGAPSRFHRDRVSAHYLEAIEASLTALLGRPARVRVDLASAWLTAEPTAAETREDALRATIDAAPHSDSHAGRNAPPAPSSSPERASAPRLRIVPPPGEEDPGMPPAAPSRTIAGLSPAQLWDLALERLRRELLPGTLQRWIDPLMPSSVVAAGPDGPAALVLHAPTDWHADRVVRRYLPDLIAAVSQAAGCDVDVRVLGRQAGAAMSG